MIWKVDGVIQKSPSTYKDNIEDTDNDSYTSIVTGALIDNPIAVGMLKLEMTWDLLTEEECQNLCQLTYRNPLYITLKCPSVKGGLLENAPFRVSKRVTEMHKTGDDEDTSKSYWKASINFMQKSLTSEQKADVEEANS